MANVAILVLDNDLDNLLDRRFFLYLNDESNFFYFLSFHHVYVVAYETKWLIVGNCHNNVIFSEIWKDVIS